MRLLSKSYEIYQNCMRFYQIRIRFYQYRLKFYHKLLRFCQIELDHIKSNEILSKSSKSYKIMPDSYEILGIHHSHKKSMKYSGHRKLLCELSKLSKFNAFNLLGY